MKPQLTAALILSLSLAACGQGAPAPDAAPQGETPTESAAQSPSGLEGLNLTATVLWQQVNATPDAMALEGEVAPVIVTLDRTQMADADCHVMGQAVMGKCEDEAALTAALGAAELIPVNSTEMADAACHYMLGAVMGTCTPEEIAQIRAAHTIVVDTETMADEPCHSMGNTIMGRCTPEDILDQAKGIAASW